MIEPHLPKYTVVQAINQAMHTAMEKDSDVVLLGQDVAQCGGVFRATEGLLEKFGKMRVMDTPLSESAIVGCGIGMALYGLKVIAEIQFSGFSYHAFHQIEGHAARFRNRTRGEYHVPMVIRMPYGGGVHAFEHHSESRETYFAHTPGLKVVIPSNPRDAGGLLLAAIEDPDPVIFMEPKKLYRSIKDSLPRELTPLPLGEAKVLQEGLDLTLISYGSMVSVALETAELLKNDFSLEVIDLRTIKPLDWNTLTKSIKKTGRAIVIHEAPKFLGMGSEIVAGLSERAFYYLKAPIARITGYDVLFPYFQLEDYYLPDTSRVIKAIRQTMEY